MATNHRTADAVKLFIIRHAKAIERGDGTAETSRFLTPEGRSSFRDTVRGAKKKLKRLDIIFTSPLVRAVQTADVLAEGLGFTGPVVVSDLLSPGCNAASLFLLLQQTPYRRVAMVGHEPDLSAIIATLCGSNRSFRFKKGGIIALSLDPREQPSRATFRWMADGGPSAIRSMEELYERYSD